MNNHEASLLQDVRKDRSFPELYDRSFASLFDSNTQAYCLLFISNCMGIPLEELPTLAEAETLEAFRAFFWDYELPAPNNLLSLGDRLALTAVALFDLPTYPLGYGSDVLDAILKKESWLTPEVAWYMIQALGEAKGILPDWYTVL